MTNKELLTWFMEAPREDVFHNFEKMEGAIGSPQDGYIFVPGALPADRRPLLVAHADTVWDGNKKKPDIKVEWDGNICTSARRDRGIGADDRAGVTMLWLLQHTGASLLLTDDEEIGCLGARAAVAAIPELLKEHLFAVQMDRRGDQQAVFYSAASAAFEKWLVETLAAREEGWRKKWGSCSDISVIGPPIGLNSTNMAAGFLFEHTRDEMLFLDAWERSVEATRHLIELAEAGKVPEMEGPRKPYSYKGSVGRGRGRAGTQIWKNGTWERWEPWDDEGLTEAAYWTKVAEEQNWEPAWLQMMLDDIEERESRKLVTPSDVVDIRPKRLADGSHAAACVCNDCWENKKSAKRAKADAAVEAFQKKQKNQTNGNGKKRGVKVSGKDALLPFEWEKMQREERKLGCSEAEMLGSDLVMRGKVEPDDDPGEIYYIHIIEEARKVGTISEENVHLWQHRLVFSKDLSDPRVMALGRGLEWADGMGPKVDDGDLQDYIDGKVH